MVKAIIQKNLNISLIKTLKKSSFKKLSNL